MANDLSVTVLDRNDRLLRAYTSADGRWRLPIAPAQVDRRYLAMLIDFEDKRFHSHRGVDAWAIGRAAWQLARHRRIVSGGSTLKHASRASAPWVRTAVPRRASCSRRCARSSLERRFSKDEIIGLYLRLAPFGGNLEGVRAASLAYFGEEPQRLSLAEAALLVALPQAPELRRPDRFPVAAMRARNRVLAHAAGSQIVAREDARRAMAEPMPASRREFPLLAAHLADAEVQHDKARLVRC